LDVFGKPISVTVSIGLTASNPNNIIDSQDMVAKADAALYSAKNRGRNRVHRWDENNIDEKIAETDSPDFHELQTKISSLTKQLRLQAMETVASFEKVLSIATKDPYIEYHAKHVQTYAINIAREMNLSTGLTERIGIAAILHDLGKICIPNYIFSKTAPLTRQERDIIHQHPIASTTILAPLGVFRHELQIIRHHHERFDGSGYPDGLKGKEIEIGARVLAVADVFDAITSDRLYQNSRTCECALKEMHDCAGAQFDPEVVEAFLKAFEKHKSEWPFKPPTTIGTMSFS